MSARLFLVGIVAVLVLLGVAAAGNYALYLHLLDQRDQVWCPLLADITGRPLPPSATPAQARAFGELVAVRDRFGCPP